MSYIKVSINKITQKGSYTFLNTLIRVNTLIIKVLNQKFHHIKYCDEKRKQKGY